MKKETEKIEIPFGAKDSELYKFEYSIPEGYEARIEDGKVIVQKKESEDEKTRKGLWKYFHDWQYSPLCHTIKDKIREYIANHFIADTVVKTDMQDIVKAMEEGVRLGMEEQKSAEMRDSRQIALMIENGRRSGVIEGRKQVVDSPEEYGLCKPTEWSEEDENIRQSLINDLENAETEDEDVQKELNEKVAWLKSLRPQPYWKPSNEQMEALRRAFNTGSIEFSDMEKLATLYEDIKIEIL